ncbi:hypothetical protein ACIGHB_30010 [Streptomyces sp. NPDC085460]|uniref:hypothetical protein n=1 Tax=Streptomyces sp. NPDC085460 TaxID=3365723 RepID=UPI0037CCD3B9
MTDTFAPSSRAARLRRLLTLLLLTAALVAAVAAANTTAHSDWWPKTGGAFTTPTTPGAAVTVTVRPQSAACGVGLDRAPCTHPATSSPTAGTSSAAQAGPVLAAPVTPSVWTTALLLLPVAAGLTVVGRTRTSTRSQGRKTGR